jgi:hypothetical protein
MAQPARRVPARDDDTADDTPLDDTALDDTALDDTALDAAAPPLDPAAVERAYRRERARRRAVASRHHAKRSSNARFWVVLAVLTFLTVLLALTAWHQIQTTFGV